MRLKIKLFLEKLLNKKNIKVILLFFSITVFLSFPILAYFKIYHRPPQKIGWISDIHAGTEKPNKDREFSSYPREYSEYMGKVFKELKEQDINIVISGGDNTNRSNKKIAAKLVEIADQNLMDMIWVKGNHDGPQTMAVLGVKDRFYYYRDLENVRIIVLDNNYGDYYGSIDEEQVAWLKEALKTEKKVIIVIHTPIFTRIEEGANMLLRYEELEKTIRESGNVKLVLSGHQHGQFERVFNGIPYKSIRPLTQRYYKGSYAIINTEDFSVEYKISQ